MLPILEFGEGDMQELMDRFAAVLPLYLPRHPALRHVSSRLVHSAHGGGLQASIGPLRQLQSLELYGGLFAADLQLQWPLRFSHLLDVHCESVGVKDGPLNVLLSAAPQLLRLRLCYCELESWKAVQIAAVHCPQLVELEVTGFVDDRSRRGAPPPSPALPLPSPSHPFLACLTSLTLCQRPENGNPGRPFAFSDLRFLLQPSNVRLQRVRLIGSSLTAVDVHSLRVLPSLRHLSLSDDEVRLHLPQVTAAAHAARARVHPTASQPREQRQLVRQQWKAAAASKCDSSQPVNDLGEWDESALARRLSESVDDSSDRGHNLLHVYGVDASPVRPLLFEELEESIFGAPAESSQVGRMRGSEDDYDDEDMDGEYEGGHGAPMAF